jgi:hypothetical protein
MNNINNNKIHHKKTNKSNRYINNINNNNLNKKININNYKNNK